MAARDFGRRAQERCPRCYEPAPCHRCVAVEMEVPAWLNGVCWVALVAIFVGFNILLWGI